MGRRASAPAALAALLAGMQALSASESVAAVGDMLDEQGINAPPAAGVVSGSLAGWASDGRALLGLMEYAQGARVPDVEFERIVRTQLQDTARSGEALAMAARPKVRAYVRMVSGPACGRCLILAGREYRMGDAFRRHPRCGCLHVPTSGRGVSPVDVRELFDGLTVEQQDASFTKAGAEAIRVGANPASVINARAGMSTAQVVIRGPGERGTAKGRAQPVDLHGGQVLVTTEGTTRRGQAYRAMRAYHGARGAARLMPESILQIATDRADAIRLLRTYGYLT